MWRRPAQPVRNPAPGTCLQAADYPGQVRPAAAASPCRADREQFRRPGRESRPRAACLSRLQGPVRARFPQLQPRAGRVCSNAGAPVRNPVPGPVFVPADQALRARLPRQPLLRGRVNSSPGAPVRNPAGPAQQAMNQPAGVRVIYRAAGRAIFSQTTPAAAPAPASGPVFYQRDSAQPRQPLPRRGICRAIRYYPLPQNPVQGPVFTQRTSPVRAQHPLPSRGRIFSSAGAPVFSSVTGPKFRPADQPARARIPQGSPRGRVQSNAGAPVRNPVQGPVFAQKTYPVRAKIPPFRLGRAGSAAGIVRSPAPGPQVYPLQLPGPRPPARVAAAPRQGRVERRRPRT